MGGFSSIQFFSGARFSTKSKPNYVLVGGFTDFFMFTPIPAEMIQVDACFFQMGWLNQPPRVANPMVP